jgi:hypothetical protein
LKKLILIACVALSFAAASSAQTQVQPAVKPLVVQPLQVATPKPELESNLPEQRIAKLEAEKRALQEENMRLREQNRQMTELGGSQVRAYCPSVEVSRNTAGAENNCASSGYNCEQVSGLCYTSCSTGIECAKDFNCDGGRCISGVPTFDE